MVLSEGLSCRGASKQIACVRAAACFIMFCASAAICRAGNRTVRLDPATLCFGRCATTETATMRAWLINESDAPVRVRRTLTSCGCTAVELGANVVKPQERVPLDISIRRSTEGQLTEWARIVCDNDVVRTIRIRGTLYHKDHRLEVLPRELRYGVLPRGQAAHRMLLIQRTGKRPVGPVRVSCSCPYLDVSAAGQRSDAEKKYFLVALRAPLVTDRGIVRDEIVVTSPETNEAVRVAVRAEIAPPIRAIPNMILINEGQTRYECAIKRTDGVVPVLESHRFDGHGLSLTREASVQQEGEVLVVEIERQQGVEGYASADLWLQYSDVDKPLLLRFVAGPALRQPRTPE